MDNGFVLVMSEWDDGAAHMLWLDSNYPPDADPSKPGVGLSCHDISIVSVMRNVIAKEIFNVLSLFYPKLSPG